MSKVHVVTDSAAAITAQEAESLGVEVVPLLVRIGDQELRDEEELPREELIQRMVQEHVRPAVVGPTADDFRAVYKRLARRTDQIISIHSSASLSRTYREARIASRDFLGRCDIVVMDSETLSLGLTILARIAAKLAAESVPLSVIVRQVRGAIRHIYVVLITETLDYLEHSHLISPAQAVLGSMLEIRPFLQVEEGEIIPLEKVRSPERAVDKLAEFAGEFTSIEQIAVLHSAYQQGERTELLLDKLEGIAPSANVPTLLYGPLLASYVGPDALGLMVYEGRDAGSPF